MHDLIANAAVALPLVAIVLGILIGMKEAARDNFLVPRIMHGRGRNPGLLWALGIGFLLFMTVSVEFVVFGGSLGPAWLQALAPQYVPLEFFSSPFDHYMLLFVYAVCVFVIGWSFKNVMVYGWRGPHRS